MKKEIQLGASKLISTDNKITGEFMDIGGEIFYKIFHYDQMPPFFMTIVSNSDHWMYLSSNGGLTAGRKNPDNAFFPYYTDDKIRDASETTGSKTLLQVQRDGKSYLWEPFSERYSGIYQTDRALYKSVWGNKIIFEETNADLGLTFSYQWMTSEKFGFIKKSTLTNKLPTASIVSVLDGMQNIIPSGINRLLQQAYSNLVDAYKKNELVDDSNIGLFMLSSVIVDKAEPSEALTANLAWSEGLHPDAILLSSNQLDFFRKGIPPVTETDVRATRGSFFVYSEVTLEAQSSKIWHLVAEVNKDAGYVAHLKHFLKETQNIGAQLQLDVNDSTIGLRKILAASDGLQLSQDKLSEYRHLSNVLFNVMRGGIYDDNYKVWKQDFIHFVHDANKQVYTSNESFLSSLENPVSYMLLMEQVTGNGDAQLIRLCYEYLPLTFSRRHGDPSRPWNLFSIEMKREDGTKNLNFQGNWRDIFQNWEALCLSFPSFVESMICKFMNATTADGYNPYRITRDGIDWEAPDPHDPWANIGYWGDHQVIYLQKFLEISRKYHPGALNKMLTENIFAYANVPYRIKRYEDLVKNPFDTIEYDLKVAKMVAERVSKTGSDGKLLWDKNDGVLHVNFTEKIIAAVLAKLSNFIPETGIWMNTQRPEWNDANNALVGNGVSMVTLYYLRRMSSFCIELFREATIEHIELSEEISGFYEQINKALIEFEPLLSGELTDKNRRSVTDALGTAGSSYREKIYRDGFSGKKETVTGGELAEFFAIALKHIDHAIRKNKRQDNLYHAYNLISFNKDEVSIRYLYEMLEGQVAVLSAGILTPAEVNEVLDALKWSTLFRRDQYSYLLYPDRQLPRFMEKNVIPTSLVESNPLLSALAREENQKIFYKDVDGVYHFNAGFRNAADLKTALEKLQSNEQLVQQEKAQVLGIFEKVFDHQSFTGRSGTFYGFEGLGCIYWHMVSKLLLAINENYFLALQHGADDVQLGRMVQHYYDVRAGIGLNKSPEVFGAFPTDAYSHTPGNGGAKQPGMTGQVKEDIISRFGELGVVISKGEISFNPGLLRKSEFLTSPSTYIYMNVVNQEERIELGAGSLAFTLCQVPVVYHLSTEDSTSITNVDDSKTEAPGLTIDASSSFQIFNRTNSIKRIDVRLTPRLH
ncbi:MAG: hypothetical protein IPG01_19235 [Chitinophagaceae bacterium]|nr:hypothetical protein [Chitinophagaceae bacterium]